SRHGQLHQRLANYSARQQIALTLHAQRSPARPMTMPGQPLERPGIGQLAQSASIEPGAFGQVVDVAKRTLRTRMNNPPGHVLTKALDHAKAQAERGVVRGLAGSLVGWLAGWFVVCF